MKKVEKKVLKIHQLSPLDKSQMFALFETYYQDVSFERFLVDLQEKTHLFLFREAGTKKLIGFSTIYRKPIPSISKGLFLFSGDTVIHKDYWGNKMLQRAFFWFILDSKLRSPLRPVYWMLMSKGVKTYLMMRKNFKKSYPQFKEKTPPNFQRVLKGFYQMKFPDAFNSDTGLIVFKEKLGAVKAEAEIPALKSSEDLEAKFFYQINPSYHTGEELACIAEIRFQDFFFHLSKFFFRRRKFRLRYFSHDHADCSNSYPL